MLLRLLLLSLLSPILASGAESYSELVKLKPLRDGKVLANWDFVITTPQWSSTASESVVEESLYLHIQIE